MTHIPHGGGPNTRYPWPAQPGQLVDTMLCPSCFTPLASAVCFVCGLDLNVPRAGEVLEGGRRMLEWENTRQASLGLMRAEQQERTAVAQHAPPAQQAPPVQQSPPVQPAEAPSEGIGALCVVLMLVDLWPVRGNDLFGTAAMDALPYWGAGMLTCAAAFLVLHAVSGLRVGSIAGFALAPFAVGMLAGGVAQPLDLGAQITVAALAAAVATAAWTAMLPSSTIRWRARDRSAERIVLYIALFAALGVASLSAIAASPDSDGAPAGWFGAIAVVAAAHGPLALHLRRAIAVTSALGSVGVVALSLIAPPVGAGSGSTTGLVTRSSRPACSPPRAGLPQA